MAYLTDLDKAGPLDLYSKDFSIDLLNLVENEPFDYPEHIKGDFSQQNLMKINDQQYLSAPVDYIPLVKIKTNKLDKIIDIRIIDNGSGIPQSIISKIFQPFFTIPINIRTTGEGTGKDLSPVYDIVKSNGAEVKVNPELDKETEFIINLNY